MSDLTGETIGPYRIVGRLGRGGMADVYKAFHTGLEIYRAIKFIRPEFVTEDDFRARFQKEAQGVARLRHHNIVQIHDFGEDDNRFYMVMEFLEGSTLKERLKQRGALPVQEAVKLVKEVAGALKYAHDRDLVHRDVKPENIMIDTDGRPVLMDFGIAKLLTTETQLTQTGMGIGTPAYMAPEQAKGLDVGPPADIYALTIVLFELLTGQVPFDADTPMAVMLKAINDPLPMPRELNPDISEPLQGVIIKGTAKEPQDRFANISMFLDALELAMAGKAPRDVPHGKSATAATFVRSKAAPARKRRVGRIAAVAALLLIGAAALWRYQDDIVQDAGTEQPAPGVAAPTPQVQAQPAAPAATATTTAAAPTVKPGADSQRPVAYAYRDELAAEEVVRSSVTLGAGDVVYLNVFDTDHTTDFTLMSPDGRDKVISSYSDHGPVTVARSGEHEFLIKSRRSEPNNVDVELLRLNTPVIDGGALQPGTYLAQSTRWPGQRVEGTVQLEQGQVVFLDVLRSEVTTDFTLVEPDGRTELLKGYSDQGPETVRTSGEYRWTADPRGDKIADFEFNLHVLAPAVIQAGPIEPGGYMAGATQQPGQLVEYSIELSAGDVVYLDILNTSATADFTLIGPDGRSQLIKSYSDRGPEQVRRTGRHLLRVDPRSDKTAEFEYQLHVLQPPVIEGGTIGIDELVAGNTQQPGQQVTYSIELPGEGPWQFERVSASATTDFRLVDTRSGREFMKSYASVKSFEVPGAGTYQLIADPRNDSLSQFEFRVLPAD